MALEQAIVDEINTGFKETKDELKAELASFSEKLKPIEPDKVEPDVAKLEQLGGITKMEVWDIPVGQALIGGFTAVFASELIDGFMAAQGDAVKGVVKLVGAGAAVKWGGRLLGSAGVKALAILLAYDGIRMLIPLDQWARRGATALTGMLPAGGLGGYRPNAGAVPASRPGTNYYAGLYR